MILSQTTRDWNTRKTNDSSHKQLLRAPDNFCSCCGDDQLYEMNALGETLFSSVMCALILVRNNTVIQDGRMLHIL